MLTLASFFKTNRFSGNNGDKVIFHAFFNYGAQSADWNVCTDEDFEGVYDAEAKTITVKASDVAGEDCVKIYNLCLELIPTTGIGNVEDTKQVVALEYYNLSGVRVNKPVGVVIEKVEYNDGSVASQKIMK